MMGAMAGWREADQASNRVLGTAGDGSSGGPALALAALERLTPRELEQTSFELLRDPAFDVLLTGESRFEELPAVMPRLVGGELPALCHSVTYASEGERCSA